VCSVIGKVLESILVERMNPYILAAQSPLQLPVASLNAALLLSETINEYQDKKERLVVTLLDAAKAFDTVWIDSMMRKLHSCGVPPQIWKLMTSWYRGMHCQVKWNGRLSESFRVAQGIGQGRVVSAHFYKVFINCMLHCLDEGSLGARIGHVRLPVIGCCDDLALAARKQESQCMVARSSKYSKKNRYNYNPGKTEQLEYGKKQPNQEEEKVYMDGELLQTSKQATHLGVIQAPETVNQKRVKANISAARGAVYSMFGAGMHGLNGLNPKYSVHLWNTVALPCLLNGTELWQLTPAETSPLEVFQRSILKQLQGLPDRTATAAVHILTGTLPVAAKIHSRALNLFRSAVADKTSREYQLAQTQLSLKEDGSSSWFMYIEDLAYTYQLPSPHELLEQTPSKESWKTTVKRRIHQHWKQRLEEEGASKSTLKHLSLDLRPGKVAAIWESAGANLVATARAQVKARVLTGTYRLQNTTRKAEPERAGQDVQAVWRS
jgi:hypothetical protein